MLTSRYFDMSTSWHVDMLTYFYIYILTSWHLDILTSWHVLRSQVSSVPTLLKCVTSAAETKGDQLHHHTTTTRQVSRRTAFNRGGHRSRPQNKTFAILLDTLTINISTSILRNLSGRQARTTVAKCALTIPGENNMYLRASSHASQWPLLTAHCLLISFLISHCSFLTSYFSLLTPHCSLFISHVALLTAHC